MAEENRMQINFQQAIQMLQQERQNLDAVIARIENFRQTLDETLIVKETLKTIQKTDAGEKTMVSLGAGVYADATLTSIKEVKITLGGGILKNATIEEALAGLEKRQEEAQVELSRLQEEERKLLANVQSLNQIARSLAPQNRA